MKKPSYWNKLSKEEKDWYLKNRKSLESKPKSKNNRRKKSNQKKFESKVKQGYNTAKS